MTTSTLTQARDLVRQLTVHEKLYLLNDLTAQLIHETTNTVPSVQAVFPVFHVAQWPANVPLRREDLYDDRGR